MRTGGRTAGFNLLTHLTIYIDIYIYAYSDTARPCILLGCRDSAKKKSMKLTNDNYDKGRISV